MHDVAPADGGIPPAKRGPGALAAADCHASAPTVPTLAPIGGAAAALPPLTAPGVVPAAGMNGMAGLANGHASTPGPLRPLGILPGSFPPIGHPPSGAAASLPPLSHAAPNGSVAVASTAGGAAAALARRAPSSSSRGGSLLSPTRWGCGGGRATGMSISRLRPRGAWGGPPPACAAWARGTPGCVDWCRPLHARVVCGGVSLLGWVFFLVFGARLGGQRRRPTGCASTRCAGHKK
eukprot:TRINITY_DN2642_c0_g1_i2.p1 TRINITY_DN2642_c0_g1~~TRINITY_DN2642_c0_g1_i2.p1  ORF type:complete len:236 (-),score=16.38 TRINITY_DN2642_c0_g1_i2:51-758(-)